MTKLFWPLYLALSIAAVAQPPAPKPPTISDALKLSYFKANSEFLAASTQAQQAAQLAQQKQALLQAAAKSINDACGKDFVPTLDASGDPVCAIKPKVEAKK